MATTKKAAGAGNEEEGICRRKYGKRRCKNASANNEVRYCQKHFEEMKKLPPDEHRCSQTAGTGIYRSRCKNFRMNHGAAADDDTVPKTRHCEKHYNFRVKYRKNLEEKKRSGDGEDSWGSKLRREKETEVEDDDTSDIQGGCVNVGTENKKLPPDEQRCCQTDGKRWRCKNFRMGHGASIDDDIVPKTRYCEKHYKYKSREFKKKTSEEIRGSEGRRKKVMDDETTQKQGATIDDSSNTIVEDGGTGSTRRKRRNVIRAEDDRFIYDTLGEFEGYVDSEDYFGTLDVNNLCKKVTGGDDEDAMMKAAAGREAQETCSGKNGKWRCKNASADNELYYCENHYKDLQMERNKLPPDGQCCGMTADDDNTVLKTKYDNLRAKYDSLKKKAPEEDDEQRCALTGGGGWRCKNYRMGHVAASDDLSVPKTRYCEKHYNYYVNWNKRRNRLKKKSSAAGQYCCQSNGFGWRCKNFRMGHGVAVDDETVPKTKYCEKHYYYFRAKYYENHKMKLPPPYERYCCHSDGLRWRCKNLRMGHGVAAGDGTVFRTRYCEKHYNYFAKYKAKYYQNYHKKRSGDGEAAGCSATGSIECSGLNRRRKKVTEEDNRSFDVTGSMQPATSDDDTSVTIVEGSTSNIRRKRKNVKRAEYDTPGESEDCDSYVDSENSVGDLMDMLGMENWNWNDDEMKWNSEADMLSCFEEDPVLSYL